MAAATYSEVSTAVVNSLKTLIDTGAYGVKQSDVKIIDFPFDGKPPFGMLVIPIGEVESDSTNETVDIGYRFQILRAGHSLHDFGFNDRTGWRIDVYTNFNRVRLGLDSETMTMAKFEDIQLKTAWDQKNVDASVVAVTTWIRTPLPVR